MKRCAQSFSEALLYRGLPPGTLLSLQLNGEPFTFLLKTAFVGPGGKGPAVKDGPAGTEWKKNSAPPLKSHSF